MYMSPEILSFHFVQRCSRKTPLPGTVWTRAGGDRYALTGVVGARLCFYLTLFHHKQYAPARGMFGSHQTSDTKHNTLSATSMTRRLLVVTPLDL